MPPLTDSHPATSAPARTGFVLLGVLLIAVNMRAPFNAVGPLIPLIQQDVGLSNSQAGLLGAIPLLSFAAFSPVAAPLSRRIGVERTILGALLVLAAGIVLRSLPVPGGIWVGTVLLGLGIALVNVLLPGIVKKNFPDKVSSVTGTYAAAQSVFAALFAGIVVPIAGADPSGWRVALGITAGLVLVGAAAGYPLINSSNRAGDPGKQASAAAAPTHDDVPAVSPWSSKLGWTVALFFGTQSMAFYALVSWLPTLEQANGIDAATAGWHLTLMMLVGVATNLLTPLAMRRMKDQSWLAAASALSMMAAWFGYLTAPSAALLWAILGGLAGGSGLVILLSLFSLRTRSSRNAAALSGMGQSVGYLFAAAGPFLLGLLRDLTGGWSVPVATIVVVSSAQAVLGFLAGRDRHLEDHHLKDGAR